MKTPPRRHDVDTALANVTTATRVREWRHGVSRVIGDHVVDEQPIALVYNGVSHVVMMATPEHLEDFALGFSLSEQILTSPQQLYDTEIHVREHGIEVAMRISAARFAILKHARRNLTGRTGCGLCGAESLEQAVRAPAPVADTAIFSHAAIEKAVAQLVDKQPLQAITGAVHGAAWCNRKGDIELLREDVGRHNALDKLYGALSREKKPRDESLPGAHFILISSRASYEMVIKAAAVGVELLVAVSAPTKLAIDYAESANITLVGFARPGRHVVYTLPHRVTE